MNSLIDDVIRDDVNRALEANKYPWIKPIVELIESQQNPFLAPDFFSNSTTKNFLSDPTAAFYLSSGYEMKVTFTESDYLKLFSSQFTDIAFSPEIADRMRTLRKTHRIFLTIKINSIESPFSFIEPMMCTAFLYNRISKCIISDLWNFVPEKCQSFFKGPQYSFDNSNTASFLIDPSIVTKSTGTFIILFSHPTTVDNGINTVLKYYQNPSSISAVSATKSVNASFTKNPNAFSTFCWSYVHLSSESINNLEFPAPFLIDHAMYEGEIFDLISEAQIRHLKQVPFSISAEIVPTIKPLILRQVSDIKILPHLAPIHQLSIHLHQMKMSALSSARNLMVRISFVSTEDNLPLYVIHSKYNSNKLVEYEYSRVCYHDKSPKFDDYFLIDLPYPLKPTSTLIFQVYHVHVKMNETKSMTEIGKAVFPLFQSTNVNKDNPKEKRKSKAKEKADDTENLEKSEKPENTEKNDDDKDKDKKLTKRQIRNQNKNKKASSETIDTDQNSEPEELVFVPDDVHTISVSSDKTSKLIFSTYLRSNIISNDKKYNKLNQHISDGNSFALDSELIKSISPITLTENLMIVLDRIIKMYEKSPFFNFEPILYILNAVLPYLKPHQLNRYLLLYVFYFAFRDTSKVNDQMKSKLDGSNDSILAGKETTSLIDLDQVGFEPKQNSDTLIDFGNDSLFKNVPQNSKRRPSLILQNLYKETDTIPIHIKMLKGIIQLIKEKETEAINLLHPVESFINGFIIKSLAVSKERSLTDDFIEYVDLYTKYSTNSDYINETATAFGKFVDLLFDIGLPTAASVANSAFIRNCPLKQILTYVSTAYRPEYFLYSVRFIESFADQFCKLVTLSFSGDNCSVMQPFFLTINQLCSIYDDQLKVEVASKLLNCLTTIIPSKISPGAQITDGVEFINFILTYCNDISMQNLIAKQKLPTLMSLIHYLLNKSTEKPLSQKRIKLRLASQANSDGVITIQKGSNKFTSTATSQSTAVTSTTTTNSPSNNSSTNSINNSINSSNCNLVLNQSDPQTSIPNITVIKSCSSFEACKNVLLETGGSGSLKGKSYFDTVKVKRSLKNQRLKDEAATTSGYLSDSPNTSSNSINLNVNESSNNIESSIITSDCKSRIDIEANKKTQTSLFRFITVFLTVSDLNGGAYLLQFAYHALQIRNIQHALVLQSYYLLHQVILKFSPGIIEIYSPCMTKVIHTLFKVALISSQYHKCIASIIAAMFSRDFATYKNNNRSFAICTRALSMIHYSQLTLERFNRFMKLLRESSLMSSSTSNSNLSSGKKSLKKQKNLGGASQNVVFDGLREFFDIFQTLRSISIDLENPKLTPSQKATILINRYYAFKYSPDAQFIALEDLKRHQSESNNALEAMNITILQAALIYEYLVKMNRMPNYFSSKFGGKHKYRLISPVSSVEAILSSRSQSTKSISPSSSSSSILSSSMYLIGSTSLCPPEIMSDIPTIPSFCDSEIFSEASFISLLYKCLSEAEKIHRTIISNFILDLIWPIYDARCLYGQMSCLFGTYENIFIQRLAAVRSHIRPKIGQLSLQQQQLVIANPVVGPASAPVTPLNEKMPFEGIHVEKKSTTRNSRTVKNRRSTRSKRGSDTNENSDSSCSFSKDASYNDEFDNVAVGSFEDSDNHNAFFRVMFCGKIFESDNGRAFIYRAEPGTTISQFTSQLNKYYEFLMGSNKIIIINDEVEEESNNNNNNNKNNNNNDDNNNNNNNNDSNNNNSNDNNNNSNNNINDNDNKESITKTRKDSNNEESAEIESKINNNETQNEFTSINSINNDYNDLSSSTNIEINNNDAIEASSNNSTEFNSNPADPSVAINQNNSSDTSNKSSENSETEEIVSNKISSQPSIDFVWKMDDNIGYIKVDKVTEVNMDQKAPSYQHQIFYFDEYSYKGSYNFIDDLFFNSSHNSTNLSNFSNIYSYFNIYNNFNNYTNDSSYLNFDTFEQFCSSNKNITNYNYTYFSIYNYIHKYMNSSIHLKNKNKKVYSSAVAQKKSCKKLAKRTMRRNFLAVRSLLPSLIERSEIIKVEASEFSPLMCAYQHLADFILKMKKLVIARQMDEIQELLISELTKNNVDNFMMIIDVFIENKNEWKKKKIHIYEDEEEEEEEEEEDDIIDDVFKELQQKIRKNRKDFDKIVPSKLMGILKLFLNTLENGIILHEKWVINNLEFVPLQYQFEFQYKKYEMKFNQIISNQ